MGGILPRRKGIHYMQRERPLKVVIIGAGIGGLAAACALRQRGIEVEVYESAPALGEVGAGVQLGPNAVKVLNALGLAKDLEKCTFEPLNRIHLNWDDASLRAREPMRDHYLNIYGAPYRTAHRAALHRTLQEAIPAEHIHLGRTCVDVSTDSDTAIARFQDGSAVEADVIVGADGIRSNVRMSLFGASQPRFTKSVAWRGIIDIAHVPELVGPQGSPVRLDRRDHFSWFGPNGQVICYPIGDGSTLNIFAGHTSEHWVDESWSVPSSKDELLEAYGGWSEELLRMFEQVNHCHKWGIFDREPIPEWTQGRVTLLGDAAHPTMPNLAQGANMAIEDAYVLARNLEMELGNPEAGLKSYVAERQPRTRRITLESRLSFENSMVIPPAPPLDRRWIYGFDATQAVNGQ
jgi:salicylate hydroxylase